MTACVYILYEIIIRAIIAQNALNVNGSVLKRLIIGPYWTFIIKIVPSII